jgi:gluconokinase
MSIEIDPVMPRANAPARFAVAVMGVSGSGKTTLGQAIAAELGLAFVDGDDLHPPANVAKMAAGTPLTDDDRWPWLDRVGATLADGAAHPGGVVVACSALRRVYRDRIRAAAGTGLRFVFLRADESEMVARVTARPDHYMPPTLVHSQFTTLEAPDSAEVDVLTLPAMGPVDGKAEAAVAWLRGAS